MQQQGEISKQSLLTAAITCDDRETIKGRVTKCLTLLDHLYKVDFMIPQTDFQAVAAV